MESSAHGLSGIDLARLEAELEAHRGRVNYVAVTGVSNVTGVVNPVHDIARIAHQHDALVVVDAAQMAAHVPIRMAGGGDPAEALDVIAFSGHKVYAPGSPGVVVALAELFADIEPDEVGGGMVDHVWLDRYEVTKRLPDREEPGTPNIAGAIGLAAALHALRRIGMEKVHIEERRLMEYALRELGTVPGLVI